MEHVCCWQVLAADCLDVGAIDSFWPTVPHSSFQCLCQGSEQLGCSLCVQNIAAEWTEWRWCIMPVVLCTRAGGWLSTHLPLSLSGFMYSVCSARCNVYISCLCYDINVRLSVHLSVMEVHWCIIANLGFKFRSQFTTHCGRGACGHEGSDHCQEEWRDHLALC